MVTRLGLLLVLLLSACATIDGGEDDTELPYGCSDLVVIARVTTLSGTSIPDHPLPGWETAWKFQVEIKRVIRGSEGRRLVQATAVAHSELRNEIDFLAVLRPTGSGAYILETAAPWERQPRPRPADACS